MTLGLVATGKRSIRSGAEYEKYFTATVEGKETELLSDGDVYDTLKRMKQIVNKTLNQTSQLSKALKGSSIESTCRNIWQFLYKHVQYKKDNPLREQLRTPARTWHDRKGGVDCDCYSIFISSVLTNLSIPHAYRMAGYDGDYQHVYVIVPKSGKSASADRGSYYVIDPVVNQFNYEAPFSKKHDQKMSQITQLSGLGECDPRPEIYRLRYFVDTQEVINRGGIPTKEFLIENGIPFVPSDDKKNNTAVYVVQTPTGFMAVPTILTHAAAEQLKREVGPCVAVAVQSQPAQTQSSMVPAAITDQLQAAAKKFNWWWVAFGAAVLMLFTGSDQNEVKSGLDGPPKKKLKSISI